MDRCHSSAIFKGLSATYSIPNSTEHDARQRYPALIVLKEDKKSGDEIANVNIFTTISHTHFKIPKRRTYFL